MRLKSEVGLLCVIIEEQKKENEGFYENITHMCHGSIYG